MSKPNEIICTEKVKNYCNLATLWAFGDFYLIHMYTLTISVKKQGDYIHFSWSLHT